MAVSCWASQWIWVLSRWSDQPVTIHCVFWWLVEKVERIWNLVIHEWYVHWCIYLRRWHNLIGSFMTSLICCLCVVIILLRSTLLRVSVWCFVSASKFVHLTQYFLRVMKVLNFVDRCKLLGVCLYRNINDRHIQQTIVMLDFDMLSSDVKSSSFSAYCLDVYG